MTMQIKGRYLWSEISSKISNETESILSPILEREREREREREERVAFVTPYMHIILSSVVLFFQSNVKEYDSLTIKYMNYIFVNL